MDPNVTLEWIRADMAAGNVTSAYNAACELADWLDRGGFPPSDPTYVDDLRLLNVPGY